MLRKAKDLIGYTIKASDDDDMGSVHDFYLDAAEWTIRYLVVDVGSWLFGRRVLLSPESVQTPQWENKVLPVNLTKQQVKESPNVDFAKPIPRQYEAELHEHYGLPAYWGSAQVPYIGGVGPGLGLAPVPEPTSAAHLPSEVAEAMQQSDTPHLYNVRAVIGYRIEATDGGIGHVADLFIDEETWDIRYLLIDTGNWLPGKQVLISPRWVESTGWAGSSIYVNVTQDQVKNSPAYDPNIPIERSYEGELHEHYGYPDYWR